MSPGASSPISLSLREGFVVVLWWAVVVLVIVSIPPGIFLAVHFGRDARLWHEHPELIPASIAAADIVGIGIVAVIRRGRR